MAFDPGRKADLDYIGKQMERRDLRPGQREKLVRARGAIIHQERQPEVQKLRNHLHRASAAGDTEAVGKISGRLLEYERHTGQNKEQHQSGMLNKRPN